MNSNRFHFQPVLSKRKYYVAVLSLVMALALYNPAFAQQEVIITDPSLTYQFGEFLQFNARLEPQAPAQQATIYISTGEQENVFVDAAAVDEDGNISYTYLVQPGVLQPFSNVYFKFEVVTQDGQTVISPLYSSEYSDTRFEWSTREVGQSAISWVKGNSAFGQALEDTVKQGTSRISQYIPEAASQPLHVYVYPSAADLQSALNLAGDNWVAGQASPALGAVLVSILPGAEQKLEMERQIPHEMAHVMLYRMAGEGYENLPVWLREGIASQAELNPNPDYARALNIATNNGAIIPISRLCQAFPQDAAGAFQAYAQSESFMSYVYEKYGQQGVQKLVSAYASGLDCDQGAQQALGVSLENLERSWRRDALKENVTGKAFENFMPYVIVIIIAVIFPLALVFSSLRKQER